MLKAVLNHSTVINLYFPNMVIKMETDKEIKILKNGKQNKKGKTSETVNC